LQVFLRPPSEQWPGSHNRQLKRAGHEKPDIFLENLGVWRAYYLSEKLSQQRLSMLVLAVLLLSFFVGTDYAYSISPL
jgi:hypothetical protein